MAIKTLITGISGQDGSYLAELLLNKGYEVHGTVRRTALENPEDKLVNIGNCIDRINLHIISLDNFISIHKIIKEVEPDECYHLAASSFVNYSFDNEISLMNNNFHSTYYLLSSLKDIVPNCKFYFAGSSEMFGNAKVSPQNENTTFNPRSLYGISKLACYHLVRNYREQYNMFACTGILYNHESPRRSHEYVTRKITSNVARIKMGLSKKLILGNLDAVRDWGYAPDYVKAMWSIMQHDYPDDYVIATGITHSVEQFLEYAFNYVDLNYKDYVDYDERFFRPSEKIPLCGDSSKARELLNWNNSKNLKEIVQEMVEYDLKLLSEV